MSSPLFVRLFIAGCLLAAVWERAQLPGWRWAGVVAIAVLGGLAVWWTSDRQSRS